MPMRMPWCVGLARIKGDLLLVSGQLGGACAGLQILGREKFAFENSPGVTPELCGHEEVLQRQLRPEARVDVIEMLESLDVTPTSMMDVSDGLSSEIMHIAKASGLGVSVYEEKIPISDATQKVAHGRVDLLTRILEPLDAFAALADDGMAI